MSQTRTVVLYGASDDLIEIEGDFFAEIDCYSSPKRDLFINGVHTATIEYTRNGLWKIAQHATPDGVTVAETATATLDRGDNPPRHPAPYNNVPSYSDLLVLTGAIVSVRLSNDEAYLSEG